MFLHRTCKHSNRVGRLEDMASLGGFLCPDHGSSITGDCIDVDGGWSEVIL